MSRKSLTGPISCKVNEDHRRLRPDHPAASPSIISEAIYQSPKRRRERLEDRLNEELAGKRALDAALHVYDEDLDEDDFPPLSLKIWKKG